jgi:hypothetical protein
MHQQHVVPYTFVIKQHLVATIDRSMAIQIDFQRILLALVFKGTSLIARRAAITSLIARRAARQQIQHTTFPLQRWHSLFHSWKGQTRKDKETIEPILIFVYLYCEL